MNTKQKKIKSRMLRDVPIALVMRICARAHEIREESFNLQHNDYFLSKELALRKAFTERAIRWNRRSHIQALVNYLTWNYSNDVFEAAKE